MLTAASTTEMVMTGFTNFSAAALTILAAVLAIGVGLLVFYWGWRKIRHSAR